MKPRQLPARIGAIAAGGLVVAHRAVPGSRHDRGPVDGGRRVTIAPLAGAEPASALISSNTTDELATYKQDGRLVRATSGSRWSDTAGALGAGRVGSVVSVGFEGE